LGEHVLDYFTFTTNFMQIHACTSIYVEQALI